MRENEMGENEMRENANVGAESIRNKCNNKVCDKKNKKKIKTIPG